jgi:hypothetical protein
MSLRGVMAVPSRPAALLSPTCQVVSAPVDVGTRVFWLLIAALLGASAFFAANVVGERLPGERRPASAASAGRGE